ncbi:MAG: hypothetical protein IH905_02315 [Proteobacteria bacterium]|nr:hypothetical protein [Pseudomonadota bacterium]
MATISKTKWLTLLGAFHFLGRRKHATKWVGRETKSVPKLVPKPLSDMQHVVPDLSDEEIVRRIRADMGELGGTSWANTLAELWGPALRESMGRDPEGWFLEKPEMEPERKVHREAEAEWLPPPKEMWEKIKKGFGQPDWPPDPDSKEYLEAREAWERREDTIAALRTIMSEHGIGSFLLIAGREVRLESLQWDPNNMAFEIDLLTEVCGEGKQKGPTYIEREPFIAVVDQFYPIPSALDRQAFPRAFVLVIRGRILFCYEKM